MKIDHLGYIVFDLEKLRNKFLELEWKEEGKIIEDKKRGIKILYLKREGYRIELVSPTDNKSPYYKLATKIKNTPYHWCYRTNNFEKDLEILKKQKYVMLDKIEKSPKNERMVFLINRFMGMVELLEK